MNIYIYVDAKANVICIYIYNLERKGMKALTGWSIYFILNKLV